MHTQNCSTHCGGREPAWGPWQVFFWDLSWYMSSKCPSRTALHGGQCCLWVRNTVQLSHASHNATPMPRYVLHNSQQASSSPTAGLSSALAGIPTPLLMTYLSMCVMPETPRWLFVTVLTPQTCGETHWLHPGWHDGLHDGLAAQPWGHIPCCAHAVCPCCACPMLHLPRAGLGGPLTASPPLSSEPCIHHHPEVTHHHL